MVMDRVDGGDDSGGRVEDVPTYFLLVTSYFSLSFDFSPLSFFFFFFKHFRRLE